jgi:6-phosphogluconolactonase
MRKIMFHRLYLFSLRTLLSISAFALTCAAQSNRILVSSSKPDQLAVYTLDNDSGQLDLTGQIPTDGPPGSFCFNKTGNRLYVSIREPGAITVYAIDKSSEATKLSEFSTSANGGYVSVHPSGKYLLSSYYSAGNVMVHRIHEDGTLSEVQQIETDANAHAVVTDPSGQFLFVPHTRPNKIFQFRLNASTGKLTPNDPPILFRKENTGPRHLWFHPTSGQAYGSNEQDSSITSYELDSRQGTLSVIETLSSLPGKFSEQNATADIEVHPSGKFVYIANRGHNSIASFTIDDNDGTLTFLEHTSVEPVPRSFNITPDGQFLIAAGQRSNKLRVFRIESNGELTHTQTLQAEGSPWWVVSQPVN